MVPILLMTDTFRGNTAVSRWHDPVWLGWFAVPLYWVHQLEEYSLPAYGPRPSRLFRCPSGPFHACAIRGPYKGKVVGVAFAAGALTHVLLFLGYGLFKSDVIGSWPTRYPATSSASRHLWLL